MADSNQGALQELSGALDTAIQLASEGRYAELTVHAAAIERLVGKGEQLQQAAGQGEASSDALRDSCGRFRRKVSLLTEVMRHATLVQAGLLQISGSVDDNYDRRGAFAPRQTVPRGRRLVNEEA
jgi:hypothetical protein